MTRKIIKRSPWFSILLLLAAATFIDGLFLSQEMNRTIYKSILSFFLLFYAIRSLIIPIVKIQDGKLFIYEEILSKPIQLNISEINNVQVFQRNSFPVSFLFSTGSITKKIKIEDWAFGSKNIQLFNFLKQNLENCTFEESKYIEPESDAFIVNLFNKNISDKILISTSSILLIILTVVMYFFFDFT